MPEHERSDIPEELKKLAESAQDVAAVDEDAAATPDNSKVKDDDEKDGGSSAAESDEALVPQTTAPGGNSVELAPESHGSCNGTQSKTKIGVKEMLSSLCLAPPDSKEGSSVEKEGVNLDSGGEEDEEDNDKDSDGEEEDEGHQIMTDAHGTKTAAPSHTGAIENSAEVLDTHKLLEFLKSLHLGPTYQPGVTTLGMVSLSKSSLLS